MPFDEEEVKEAENYKELQKYDQSHSHDDPDFLKNRPKIVYKRFKCSQCGLKLALWKHGLCDNCRNAGYQ